MTGWNRRVEIDESKWMGQNRWVQIDQSKYTGPKRWVQEIGSRNWFKLTDLKKKKKKKKKMKMYIPLTWYSFTMKLSCYDITTLHTAILPHHVIPSPWFSLAMIIPHHDSPSRWYSSTMILHHHDSPSPWYSHITRTVVTQWLKGQTF